MKHEIEAQQNNLKELIKLMQENPTRRVIAEVDSDIVADDYSWWTGNFGKAELEEIYAKNERIYIKSDDEDEEDLLQMINDDNDTEIGWNEEKAKKLFDNLGWEKVITVRITI